MVHLVQVRRYRIPYTPFCLVFGLTLNHFAGLSVGKTSTIVAAAKRMYGAKAYQSMTLELNASDSRGIDVSAIESSSGTPTWQATK